jgi:hypothetical protein
MLAIKWRQGGSFSSRLQTLHAKRQRLCEGSADKSSCCCPRRFAQENTLRRVPERDSSNATLSCRYAFNAAAELPGEGRATPW